MNTPATQPELPLVWTGESAAAPVTETATPGDPDAESGSVDEAKLAQPGPLVLSVGPAAARPAGLWQP